MEDTNDGLLDRVGDALEDVLATDIAPTEPEDPWERRQRLLDSWTAVILAIAAVATTWASFQASQWSDRQSDAQSASAMQRSDAGRAASDASTAVTLDSQMWLSWLAAVGNGNEERAKFFRERFSPTLATAQKDWLDQVPRDPDGLPIEVPPGTPLDQPSYIVPEKAQADELAAKAEENLGIADQASGNSTAYVLLAVFFALALFFGSIATKFSSPRVQVFLILASILVLLIGVVRLLLMPQLI